MIATLLLTTASLSPQVEAPPSRPTSRPSKPTVQRQAKAEWGDDAPGQRVVPVKFLPIQDAPYASVEAVKTGRKVSDADLVIGLVVDGQPFAYPINMLGGPDREIINEEWSGVRFCVNW